MPSSYILLVFKAAIDSEQYIEFGGLCGIQKVIVLESTKTSVASTFALMARQVISQSVVDALVKENPHESSDECLAGVYR